ncbi:MAG: glucosaminidase domain-containing protein [Prevotellaceae bacterium]|jgi:LysM repeat protein|nr:glucosaminidase domain-containing protein [Prevotellaceae bacterium]
MNQIRLYVSFKINCEDVKYPRLPLALLFFILLPFGLHAQNQHKAYLDYIDNYYQLAMTQQREHGVPASIILAQGLLESAAGKSELATKANNHFGIKCHDWTGEKIYYDDDRKNECFRKYNKALDSYEDHSAFLRNRSRYASLFDLDPTDYQGWAHGLKKAGYATDPNYAYKLISIIETYDLHRFDINANVRKNTASSSKLLSEKIEARPKHDVMRNNGVRYVVSQAGDTYASIASEFRTREKKIRNLNEISPNVGLTAGEIVYIGPKKKKSSRNYPTHIVLPGESMHSISQKYAMQVKILYDLNGIPYSEGAVSGLVLKLR